jgi:hypothetical protein
VPYGTDSRLNLFQAINCLATIIQSLRDGLRSSSRIPKRLTLGLVSVFVFFVSFW